jgi:hypothetical protein
MTNQKKKTNKYQIEPSETIKKWENLCSSKLVGKTIKSVRYQFTCEMKDMGWSKKSLVIFFTDGSYLFSSADDEANNGGAYICSFKGLPGIPTI